VTSSSSEWQKVVHRGLDLRVLFNLLLGALRLTQLEGIRCSLTMSWRLIYPNADKKR
jgi:hypothetical protein